MTQRIRYAQSGERLSARYVNRLVDGANLALKKLGPPRSTQLTGPGSADIDTDAQGTGDLTGVGSTVYTEEGRETSTVRVEDPNDSDVFVEVDRIDVVRFRNNEGDPLTLVFDNT